MWIKLSFHPVGPHPIKVMLNDSAINQSTGMHMHARA